MPFFLDTQETSHRFGSQVTEVRSLLNSNHIRHGAPDDLFEFARVLENSNQFRNDLSALVKSVVRESKDQLLLTDMMSIIAAAVAGPSFADTSIDLTKPTNALMEFLLGTGCWRQFGSPSQSAAQAAAPSFKPPIRAEEPRSFRVPAAIPPTAPEKDIENPADLINTSSELRQMLTRLEINTLQVKLHLESIEQRISKMQRSPEVLPTPASLPPEPVLHPTSSVRKDDEVAAQTVSAFEPTNRGRAVFSHEPRRLQYEEADSSSPTFAFAADGAKSTMPIGAFIAVAVVIAVVLFFVFSAPGKALLGTGMSHLKGSSAAPSNSSSANPGTSSSNPSPPPSSSVTTPASPAPAATSDSGNSDHSAEARFVPDNPDAKYIQSNVMEGYLLSAPKPEYPSFALRNHIQGTVALQATISRSGSIRTLHAVKGPPSLRTAAVEAVRHWHYKPYTVNGQPTEVATTVYVHFNPGPPPTVVR